MRSRRSPGRFLAGVDHRDSPADRKARARRGDSAPAGLPHRVRNHFQPGDIIIPGIPHVFEYYAGMRGDYYTDSILTKKIIYNDKFTDPRFMDKFRGYPAIRSLKELREVTSRGRRTWLIFVPSGGIPKLNSPEARVYLNRHAKVVFESYRAKVLLIGGDTEPVNLTAGYSAE